MIGVFSRVDGLATDAQAKQPVVVTATGSPFTYTAPYNGTLYVSGGGIESMTLKRGGAAAYPVGQFYGAKPLRAHDALTIRYSNAPALVFFPG